MTTPIKKLLAVAVLGAIALFLGVVVTTLQIILLRRRRNAVLRRSFASGNNRIHSNTIAASTPISPKDLHLWKQYTPISNAPTTAAKAYWNQAEPALAEWDATLDENENDMNVINHTHALYSLQQASKLGNAEAQYYMANALASGIGPIKTNNNDSLLLEVPEDVDKVDHQTTQAHLLWHMAAMDGHVDSAVALGYRNEQESCQAALPYYEAAANGVMDLLESSKTWRGKVTPPMDKHVLAQVHMHGGTSSQLNYHNKPDESAEALQYYHLRATMTPEPDLNAAYTLGHLYHYGLRGVVQNMTLALKYYEIAADRNHWEAGGQAGKFHFWALGMDPSKRNLQKAFKYFRKGAPGGIEGCMERFKQNRKKSEDQDTALCDHPSLNGMGLVYLFGIPHLLPVDYEKARKYFKLSKQMGNMDAAYNLAMLKLGWKENYAAASQDAFYADDNGQTMVNPLLPNSHLKPYKGPNKSQYVDAVNDLATAAMKGHVQARHRLGLMYSRGVVLENVHGKDLHVVSKDCHKALTNYKYVVDNASPSLSQRTRQAYKQYMAGDYERSLRNYLAAAETGSEVGQINAAFLLEQGTCLGLSSINCARASVRLWKAAAQQGNAEACLRVGDFYYYGRLRNVQEDPISPIGPFQQLQYLVYPEKVIPLVQKAIGSYWRHGDEKTTKKASSEEAPVCDAQGEEDGTCLFKDENKEDEEEQENRIKSDLVMAAHYYRMAAERHKSPRANFNLGYMHEWGLGLTQDFPLAKRHYDLASPASSSSREAEVPVQIALWFLQIHESIVKACVTYQDWLLQKKDTATEARVPKMADNGSVGHPVPMEKVQSQSVGATSVADVIISHMLSWETLLIVVLTIVLSKLVQHRRTRPTR